MSFGGGYSRQEISFELISGEQFTLRLKNYMNGKLLAYFKQLISDETCKYVPE